MLGDSSTLIHQQRTDKSPKGSVDEPIQELVDLINAHPSYSTLSSCSGRISLFDPGRRHSVDLPDEQATDTGDVPARTESGKGSGGWLLVSHLEIEPSQLLDVFRNQPATTTETPAIISSSMLSFKLEPMLLHVAAATLKRGQQLLQLALRLGFRESGLIVTSTRITVAIRGYGLTLSVPLAFQGPLRTSNEYLEALVVEANQRLRTNLNRIQRVFKEMETEMFRPAQSYGNMHARPLPDLNLWGHAAVAVAQEGERGDVTLLVFGGYGRGPSLILDGLLKEPCKSSQRSDKVYSLQRAAGVWDSHWQTLQAHIQASPANHEIEHHQEPRLCLKVAHLPFSARESAAACMLPGSSLVAIFGGRKGPAQPLDELLLYAYPDRSVQQPIDIRGDPPSARWGHSLTALSGVDGKLAVLVGGRNETSSFGSLHVLSIVDGSVGSKSLLWESIAFDSPIRPRFHHSCVSIDDRLIVFGGLSDPSELLEAFAQESKAPRTFSFKIAPSPVAALVQADSLSPRFGQSACVLAIPDAGGKSKQTLLITGGLPQTDERDTDKGRPIEWLQCSHKQDESKLSPLQVRLNPVDNRFDFGALLHHSCVPLPTASNSNVEVALVGGGAPGFAFSQCFASSHHLEITVTYESQSVVEDTPLGQAFATAKQIKAPSSTRATSNKACVVYVVKQNAKSLKTLLEEASLLDKTFRMTAADLSASTSSLDSNNPSLYIAVPVTAACLSLVESMRVLPVDQQAAWLSLVQGTGEQSVPYSTAYFARQRKDFLL